MKKKFKKKLYWRVFAVSNFEKQTFSVLAVDNLQQKLLRKETNRAEWDVNYAIKNLRRIGTFSEIIWKNNFTINCVQHWKRNDGLEIYQQAREAVLGKRQVFE